MSEILAKVEISRDVGAVAGFDHFVGGSTGAMGV